MPSLGDVVVEQAIGVGRVDLGLGGWKRGDGETPGVVARRNDVGPRRALHPDSVLLCGEAALGEEPGQGVDGSPVALEGPCGMEPSGLGSPDVPGHHKARLSLLCGARH